MKRALRFLVWGFVILANVPAFAQQTDIHRYTLFTGFDYMISLARKLSI